MAEKSDRTMPTIGKIFLYGLLIGVGINVPFIAVDLYHNLSKASLFESIQIGMPVNQVEQILQDGNSMRYQREYIS